MVENKRGDVSMPMPGGDTQVKIQDFQTVMWIDKKLLIDIRQDANMKTDMPGMPAMTVHQITIKKDLKVNEPVDESKFAFTPPADAKEVKEFGLTMGPPPAMGLPATGLPPSLGLLPKGDLVGKDASIFDLKGIDGKLYSLARLKDKTVMLDFWATWCDPCRESMPSMEKIYSDYKDRGLVVLGVNVAEERDVIDAFVQKHSFAYPIVMSGESAILTDHKVNAYPTFILIEEGRVIAQQIGFPVEPSLRDMLEKSKLTQKQ